jgi:hypothetical protein
MLTTKEDVMNPQRLEATPVSSAAYQLPEGFLLLSAELSAVERTSVLHSLVLAYAAADKANAEQRARPAWVSALDGTLAKIGWVALAGSGGEFESTDVREVTGGVARDLPGVLREVAQRSVALAFDGLARGSEGVPVTPSNRVFHLCSAWRDAGRVRLNVSRIIGDARVEERRGEGQGTKVATQVGYRWRTLGMLLNEDVYAPVRGTVASKVEPVLARYAVPASLPLRESASAEKVLG